MYTPWHADLPQRPKRQGFSRGTITAMANFEPEAGPPKRRLRHTAFGKTQPETFELTGAQVTIFEDYFDNTLAGGVLPFLWQSPRDDAPFGWLFDERSPYTLTPIGGDWWDLSVNINRLP